MEEKRVLWEVGAEFSDYILGFKVKGKGLSGHMLD